MIAWGSPRTQTAREDRIHERTAVAPQTKAKKKLSRHKAGKKTAKAAAKGRRNPRVPQQVNRAAPFEAPRAQRRAAEIWKMSANPPAPP